MDTDASTPRPPYEEMVGFALDPGPKESGETDLDISAPGAGSGPS